MNNGPECKCGSRRTFRVGESALLRRCYYCDQTYAYRIVNGHLVPLARITALALDEDRTMTGRAIA